MKPNVKVLLLLASISALVIGLAIVFRALNQKFL